MITLIRTAIPRLVDCLARHLIRFRVPIGLLLLALTLLLAWAATQTRFDAGLTKLLPQNHEFMAAYHDHAEHFTGSNRVMISLEWQGDGDIYNAEFMERLRQATDEVYFTPGINRTTVRSLFTPETRYLEVTEYGFMGGEVIPSRFTGSPEHLAQVRSNVEKSGQIGNLVANDLGAAMVQAELLEFDPATGERTDYAAVAAHLENIRQQLEDERVEVHILGFAKVLGDIMEGLGTVMTFFAVAFVITTLLLWGYSRSLRLTAFAIFVALLPVTWLLGLLPRMGYGIDPMSMLVPFLLFSMAVSHAVQMINAWKQEVAAGLGSAEAAENAFRKLAIPGSVALLTNVFGFLVIMLIDIPMLHELGVTACLGIGLMIFSNLCFMPILLSFLPAGGLVTPGGEAAPARHRLWWPVSRLAEPGPALASLAVMLGLLALGIYQSRQLVVGDIGEGIPELRADSRYNLDNASIMRDYDIGMNVLSIYAETRGEEEACLDWEIMNAIDRFDLQMRGVDGVDSVSSVAGLARLYTAGNNEGNPRWQTLQRSSMALRAGSEAAHPANGLNTAGCETINLMVYLRNQQNDTLKHVVAEAERFIAADDTPGVSFRLAGGNAGVTAATNEAVERSETKMLVSIFTAIALLCWLTFRSWRGVLCVLVPLTVVSILCNALMSLLGIGLKVSTLPVIPLGVGVGVDYGVYIYERLLGILRQERLPLREAYYQALKQRGTAAVFTALTMSIGVATWAMSSLKFQADMGVLLAFMFLVNVLGAIFVLPALACWLGAGQARRRGATTPRPLNPATQEGA
ncbi:efflux RND transporter permease subunit [Halomonas sp. H5]|uniref:efflux RND transporter permease subunit n=1 Tax=Halomonas sp. H5 TaxID=3423910 RepID=UPI003D35A8C8